MSVKIFHLSNHAVEQPLLSHINRHMYMSSFYHKTLQEIRQKEINRNFKGYFLFNFPANVPSNSVDYIFHLTIPASAISREPSASSLLLSNTWQTTGFSLLLVLASFIFWPQVRAPNIVNAVSLL